MSTAVSSPETRPDAPPLGVALAGFMGVGKSTVGRAVADAVGLPFADLDASIVAAAGGVAVPEIFEREGEAGFRSREAEQLREACLRPPHVLALGGGTLHQPGALARVRGAFVVVVLCLPWAVLAERLAGDSGRPLAGDAERLFRLRAAGYAQAGVGVDAAGSVAAVSRRVIQVWRLACAST